MKKTRCTKKATFRSVILMMRERVFLEILMCLFQGEISLATPAIVQQASTGEVVIHVYSFEKHVLIIRN